MLPVTIGLDPNRPRPLFFMNVAELEDFKERLARGDKPAQAELAGLRKHANQCLARSYDERSLTKAGRDCRHAALAGLWTDDKKYLDAAADVLVRRAVLGPGSAGAAHTDHYGHNFYSYLEAYDYLCAAGALSAEQRRTIEETYFRKSMALTRNHWASRTCSNHGLVEDEAAVLAGACLQDEAIMRFGLQRTFHHLAHDVLDDGSWYQDSPLIHNMNVGRFRRFIRACLNSDIDLRAVRLPPIPHPPYPAGAGRPRAFGMLGEPMVLLSTPDLKIPCSGYYTHTCPFIEARPHDLSEVLSWQGTKESPEELAERIRQQKSTLLPSVGFAALRSGPEKRLNYVLMNYGPSDGHPAHHKADLNFVIWADGRFLTADFSRIDGWATPLYRSYVEQTWSHNCVVVDQKPHKKNGGELVYFGECPGLSLVHAQAAKSYKGVAHNRVLALTDRYLVCFDRLSSDRAHTYDWMFHFACGPKSVKTPLKALSKPAAISYPHFENVRSYAPEEQTVFVGDCDGVGLAVRVLGAVDDEVAFADCPARIKQEAKTPLVERVGKIVARRSGTDVVFFSVYEPIRGKPLVERIVSPGSGCLRLLCREGRVDTVDLNGGDAGYVWRSAANGTETARACLLPETK